MDATVITSTLIGAIIGTVLGSWILVWRSESGLRKVRKTATNALDLFKRYGNQDKPYSETTAEFNSILNIAEKRSVLVALHKIGVPVSSPSAGHFDIKNVSFWNEKINSSSIEDMKLQIERGNCDRLFFLDVEKHFNENLRINSLRNIGKLFVNEVLRKSTLKHDGDKFYFCFQDDWDKQFSFGQLNAIFVLRNKLQNDGYYDKRGNPNENALDSIVSEIDAGLWDKYLNTDILEYQNLQAQANIFSCITSANSKPSSAPLCANFKPIESPKAE